MQIWLQGEYGPPHRGEAEFHANDDVHASVRTATVVQIYLKSYEKDGAWVYRYSRSEPLPAPPIPVVTEPVTVAAISPVAGRAPVRARAAGRSVRSR
jgi:hypothetical protein